MSKTYGVLMTDYIGGRSILTDLTLGDGVPCYETEDMGMAQRVAQRIIDENTRCGHKFAEIRIKNAELGWRSRHKRHKSSKALEVMIVRGAVLDAMFKEMRLGAFNGDLSTLEVVADE